MHGHPVYLPRRGRGGDVATIEGRSHHQSLMLHRDELEKGRDEGARQTVGETRVEKEKWCSAELLQLKGGCAAGSQTEKKVFVRR
jgi:hypothetical protein